MVASNRDEQTSVHVEEEDGWADTGYERFGREINLLPLLGINQSSHPSIYLSIYLSIYQSTYLSSNYLFIYLSNFLYPTAPPILFLLFYSRKSSEMLSCEWCCYGFRSVWSVARLVCRNNTTKPVKKLSTVYEPPSSVTVITSFRQLSITRVRSIQSTDSKLISLRTILTLKSHLRLCLRCAKCPWGFSTKIVSTDLNQIVNLKMKATRFLEISVILISRINANIPEYLKSSSAAPMQKPQT